LEEKAKIRKGTIRIKRRIKSTFLKDPIESLIAHLGNIVDKTSGPQVFDSLILLGLAYTGYRIAERNKWDPLNTILSSWIGYKLATTMGGAPPVSQIAGLFVLGSLGLASLPAAGVTFPSEEERKSASEQGKKDAEAGLAPKTQEEYKTYTEYGDYLASYYAGGGQIPPFQPEVVP